MLSRPPLRRMLTTGLLLAVCLSVSAMHGCAKPPVQLRSRGEIIADLEKANLREQWVHRLTLLPGEHLRNIWRVGDSVYITTSDAHLIRLNASSGTQAWDIELGTPHYAIFRPADIPGGKYLLVVNRGKGFILDKQTGDIKLQRELAFAVNTDPVVIANSFAVGGVERFQAMDIDILSRTKWVIPAPGDEFLSRPAVEGESVLLASEAGRLWRLNGNSGEWVWKDRRTQGRVIGGLAADARAVYIPCLDGKLYAFEMSSGSELWNRPLEGRLDNSVYTTRSDVLVPASGKGIYCLSTSRGEIRWLAENYREIGTIVRDRVWVSDRAGKITALALENGQVLASVDLAANVITNEVDQLVLTINRAAEITAYSTAR